MENNSKPMYQPWNEEEFQADVFVRGMTWLQRHLYRALLQAMFFHSTRPYLPNDDEVLWVLAGADSPEMWEQNKARVLKRFTAVEGKPELLEHKRVTADWERLTDARSRMSELGERSAAARRALHGTAQPQKPSKTTVVLTATERTFDERSNESRTDSEQGIVSEVEVKQEKTEQATSGQVVSSSKNVDWKNIAVRYRNMFGKKAGAEFKKKYYDACNKYTEDVVLECFDLWATEGKREWCEANGFDKPLHLFFKKLPDEAEDAVEVNTEIKRQKTEKVEKQKQQVAAEEKSVAIQNKEIIEQFAVKPQTNTAVIDEDFFKE